MGGGGAERGHKGGEVGRVDDQSGCGKGAYAHALLDARYEVVVEGGSGVVVAAGTSGFDGRRPAIQVFVARLVDPRHKPRDGVPVRDKGDDLPREGLAGGDDYVAERSAVNLVGRKGGSALVVFEPPEAVNNRGAAAALVLELGVLCESDHDRLEEGAAGLAFVEVLNRAVGVDKAGLEAGYKLVRVAVVESEVGRGGGEDYG